MGLLWTDDEDGQRVHRLQSEWDGNKGPSWQQGDYHNEADNWEVSAGTTWSRLGLGIDVDWGHESAWLYEQKRRQDFRRVTVTLSIGPWYVSWMVCKPLEDK